VKTFHILQSNEKTSPRIIISDRNNFADTIQMCDKRSVASMRCSRCCHWKKNDRGEKMSLRRTLWADNKILMILYGRITRATLKTFNGRIVKSKIV